MTIELPLYMANHIRDDSWLREEKYQEFVKGFNYATTQTPAIPALSKCSPEEIYWAFTLIQRGMLL